MNFISPLNFFFTGLIGAILLLYILRLKRKERVVSSTLLWQSALRDLQANAPWQKLRSSLLMWLQILFLLLIVLALVRPAIKVLSGGGQTIAIVMDASASMGATDVSPSRFAAAQKEANRLISALSAGDQATIISAASRTRVLAPLSSSETLLHRAVAGAITQDTNCNLREAIVLASSLLRNKKNARIYVLSDGAVAPVRDLNLGKAALQFVQIGRRNDNLAVTAADARRDYSGGNVQIFATVHNFSKTPRDIKLELSRNGDLVAVRPLSIPAGKSASQLFDDVNYQSGLFRVGFEEKDDLAADNFAFASLDAARTIKVLLLSKGNLFLEKALNLDKNVQLSRASSAAAATGKYDVIVCDGIAPAANVDTNQLVFNTITPLSPVEKVGVVTAPSVVDWDKKHPVTRYAGWSDVRFASALAVKLKSWGQAVVEAERTPLIVTGQRGGKRVVWCGFDVRETDLPLRVAFPIFITSSLQWLTASRGSSGESDGPTRSGEVVALQPPAGAKEISVQLPEGSTQRVPVDTSPLLFSQTGQVGLYRASAGKNWQKSFGISLLSKNESDLAPRKSIEVGVGQPIEGQSSAKANKELWGYIALIAILLLGAEWWVFHRGV